MQEFLLVLDALFIRKERRLQALNLLSAFVRFQPPHLYLVLQTPLIEHLIKCLLIDASATVVYLALNILVMFLPHITSSLVSYVPRLFLIYTRILCWDRYGRAEPAKDESPAADRSNTPEVGEEERDLETDPGWEKMHQSLDNADSTPPTVDYLFTFLYGLFPLNFMNFIYKPRKYLKHVKFPGAEDLDFKQDIIRSRSEPHRRVHLLHPNFFNFMSADDELADNQWLKSDPADLVTECMELCVAVSALAQDPGPPPTAKLPDIPESLVRTEDIPPETLHDMDDNATPANDVSSPTDLKANSSWRNTRSTVVNSVISTWNIDPLQFPRRVSPARRSHPASRSSRAASPASKARESPSDSPTLPPKGVQPVADNQGEESLRKAPHSSRKGSVASVPSYAGASPRLEAFAHRLSHHDFPLPPVRQSVQGHNLAFLQREVMLLHNDLNFERYLKQQHLAHIGHLQRKNIKEATIEAETQNLINNNRMLKAKLAKSNEQYARLKKETVTSRNQSKKWETELSSKVRSYREEEKQWQAEKEALRLELEKVKKDSEHLRRLVVESEARELLSQQKLRSLELDMEELEALRQEVELLQAKLRGFERRELEFEQTKEDQEILRTELDAASLKLNSRDAERERQRRIYDRKIAELESRLQSAEQPLVPGQLPPSIQQVVEAALAASQSRMQQLKKAHTRLLHKYTELEMRLAEVEGEEDAEIGPIHSPGSLHSLSLVTGGASASSFGRKSSLGGTSNGSGLANTRSGFHRSHTFSEPTGYGDEDDDLDAYGSRYAGSAARNLPRSSSSFPPGRPMRLENPQSRPQPAGRSLSPTTNMSLTFGPDSARDVHAALQGRGDHARDRSRDEPPASSSKSAFSVESGDKATTQITPKSEVRVYGRGELLGHHE